MIEEVTGIILAGGKSSRMGEDKSFIKFGGKPLIEVVLDTVSPIFENMIIITNKPQHYQKYGIRTQVDIIKDRGPLGGIYTGLLSSDTMYNFVVACDMPFIKPDLIRYMMEKIEDSDIIIPKWNGKFEPLCAIYSKKCIKPIEQQLSKGNLKITDFFNDVNSGSTNSRGGVKVKIITEKEVARFDLKGSSFVNINTPQAAGSLNRLRI